MIKCEVIENFSLKEFDKLKIIERKGKDTRGQLNKGDIFECDEEMAKYLTGGNPLKKVVVEVIEVKEEKPIVEEKHEEVIEEAVKEKPKKKKTSKK